MAKDLQAGDLDRLITPLRPDFIQQGTGERLVTFDPQTPISALFTPGNGGETAGADKRPTASEKDTFTVRYSPDITALWRLLYEGATYTITAVSEGPGRKMWTVLTAERTDVLNPA